MNRRISGSFFWLLPIRWTPVYPGILSMECGCQGNTEYPLPSREIPALPYSGSFPVHIGCPAGGTIWLHDKSEEVSR